MKKTLSLLSAVAIVAAGSTAFAAATIVNSKHDLASTNNSFTTYKASNTDQTCVFCHTPHNSRETRALWNRIGATAASGFKLYTSGANNEAVGWYASGAKNNGFAAGSSSLLCMTCHDGVTTMSALQNPPLTTAADNASAITGAAAIGTDLTNDHPVNIDYVAAQAAFPSTLKATPDSGAQLVNTKYVECASCHNVHDPTIVPFLRGSNAGSALCRGCHIK